MHSRLIFLQIFAFLLLINLISLASSLRTTQSGKAKYCGKRLEHWRDRVCKWPGESQPCLQLHHSAKERIATKCCQNGCELEDIKEACCFTQVCLNRCYPGKGYRVGSVYK